jgi:hypothetical protein
MATDKRLSDRERDLRQLLAARAIAEGRKRYPLTIGELFPDGDAAAQWVFSLTVLVEDISVLMGPLSEARKDDDIRASLFFYRQLVTRLYEARRLATSARTVPDIASFVGDLLRQPPGGVDLEAVYRRGPDTETSTVERLYGELRHRTVHYLEPGSEELADVLWDHSGYPAHVEFAKDKRGRPTVWFQWVQAVTAADVFGDVGEPAFVKLMNERGELIAAIATAWTMVAAVALALHVRRLGIDSAQLGQMSETPPDAGV